jgi:D-sedoheptulose 7-phosphate isomerase
VCYNINPMDYIDQYLSEAVQIIGQLDRAAIQKMVTLLVDLRARQGRLFILGVGGGAAHASHAVNDFRKIAGIETYAPSDNVAELTARINDDGWESSYASWLLVSRLSPRDMLLVFSVGGGSLEKNVSPNLVRALQYARQVGAAVCGVVGRNGGYTARVAEACLVIPTVNAGTVTPHVEAFQAVVWHLLVSHPALQAAPMKWESVENHPPADPNAKTHPEERP